MNKLLLIVTTCAIFSANINSVNAQKFRVMMPPGYNKIVQGEELPGVEGSQYLSEEWTNGSIILANDTVIESIKLRLNVYTGEMHYKYEDKEYAIGAPENTKEVTIGSRKFIYYPYKDKETISHSYFEVLVDGKTELLLLHYITRMPANYNAALDTGEKNDRLKLSERYYIKNGDSIVEHDKKGKNLIATVGSKSDQIKKQIEEEDLSFKKKEDLIKIVTFINTVN